MREAEVAVRFLNAKLSGYAPLVALVGDRIINNVAPDGTPFPYVTFAKREGIDMRFAGADINTRIVQQPLFQVHVITEGTNRQSAYDISNVIDAALEGSSLDITLDGVIYHVQGCWREMDEDYTSVDEGVQHNYVGGHYRLFISR